MTLPEQKSPAGELAAIRSRNSDCFRIWNRLLTAGSELLAAKTQEVTSPLVVCRRCLSKVQQKDRSKEGFCPKCQVQTQLDRGIQRNLWPTVGGTACFGQDWGIES